MTDGWFVIFVVGDPAPQGSKRHVGKGVMVESSKAVRPWREAVARVAASMIEQHRQRGGFEAFDGPLTLEVEFQLRRPGSLSKRRLAQGPCRMPDLSKLIRSTEDALTTAGVWRDDGRVVEILAQKVYAEDGQPCGARIVVRPFVNS